MKLNLFIGLAVVPLLAAAAYFGLRKDPDPTATREDPATRQAAVESAFGSGEELGGTDDELRAEAQVFMEQLRIAYLDEDDKRIGDLFSFEALFKQAQRIGLLDLDGLSSQDRAAVEQEMMSGMDEGALLLARGNKWREVEVKKIEKLGKSEMVIYVRALSATHNFWNKLRYWLLKNKDGSWQAYDHEELSQGLRASIMIGLAGTVSRDPPNWLNDYESLGNALEIMARSNSASANLEVIGASEKLLGHEDLPKDLAIFAHSMNIAALYRMGRFHGMREHLDAVEKLSGGGTPANDFQSGHYHAAMGNYPDAIASYSKYADVLGWDSTAYEPVANCYYRMRDFPRALEIAEQGLADNPQSVTCVWIAAFSLPEDRLRELGGHIDQLRDPERAFKAILQTAFENDNDPVFDYVLAKLKKDIPDSSLINDYELPVPD